MHRCTSDCVLTCLINWRDVTQVSTSSRWYLAHTSRVWVYFLPRILLFGSYLRPRKFRRLAQFFFSKTLQQVVATFNCPHSRFTTSSIRSLLKRPGKHRFASRILPVDVLLASASLLSNCFSSPLTASCLRQLPCHPRSLLIASSPWHLHIHPTPLIRLIP